MEGWPLRLKTMQSQAYLYKWSGPNGWSMEYETFASNANEQERLSVTAQDAGEYKVQLINNEGCIAYEGSTLIDVTPAPQAPCILSANSSTSSVAGVGDYDFTSRSFVGSGNFYTVAAAEGTAPGTPYMRFAFAGATPPLPGVYTVAPTTFGLEPGTVGLYIETITYQFYAWPDQKVYVTKVNGKLSVSFCSLTFGNPLNPSKPITISANVTEP